MTLTNRFDEAFRFAHELHRVQTRKGTSIPYISHLMMVSALVVEHGGDEDQAIAALLHDAAEDQGVEATLQEIRHRFGDGVACIVADCTDPRGRRNALVLSDARRHLRPGGARIFDRPLLPGGGRVFALGSGYSSS